MVVRYHCSHEQMVNKQCGQSSRNPRSAHAFKTRERQWLGTSTWGQRGTHARASNIVPGTGTVPRESLPFAPEVESCLVVAATILLFLLILILSCQLDNALLWSDPCSVAVKLTGFGETGSCEKFQTGKKDFL